MTMTQHNGDDMSSSEEIFENPFPIDDVLGVLSQHRSSSPSQKYSGMHLKTLAKRLHVRYDHDQKWEIVRDLREHPNIEASERAPLKYVSDEQLERRREREERKAQRELERQEAEDANWEALQALVADHDDLQRDADSLNSRTWYDAIYDDRYRVEFRVKGHDIRMKVNYNWGCDVREVVREEQVIRVDDVDAIIPALEAFDTYVQSLMDVGAKLIRR